MQVYLDNSATTSVLDEVIEVMNRMMRDEYGNPSSAHIMGINAENAINNSRQIISSSINAVPKEIIFTSGGTESNNIAIKGSVDANARKGRHIITSKIEHSSVLNVFKQLESDGYEVDYIGVSEQGIVDVDKLKNLIRDDTIFVSIMRVNNETGVIQPVEEIGGFIRQNAKNAIFHVDAVQAFGKMPIDVNKLKADLITLSSHKIHGPKGMGALYIKEGTKVSPVFLGGGQEQGLRPGTENVPAICGFATAAQIAHENIETSYNHVSKLKQQLINGLQQNIHNCAINPADTALAIPYILNVSFVGVRAEVLLRSLEAEGIYVSTGSACSSRRKQYSHVLQNMCICKKNIEGAVRISFSRLNTAEEISYVIEKLPSIVDRIRRYQRR